jgi:hypothetical protein
MMSPDNPVLNKLRTLNVKVDAIVIDPLAVGGGTERVESIRHRLLSTGEPTAQRQFQKLLDDLSHAIAATGKQPYSEGPYFLHALTESLGGQSRPVHPANLGEVAWHSVFPETLTTGNVAPGSRWLVVVAKANDPVRLCFDESGTGRDLLLRYNRETDDYSREPKDSTADVRVRYHATSRYVTWLINAPGVTCVDPPAAYYGNNVELRWLTSKPVSAGEPLPIELELTRWLDEGPSLKWWRDHMAQRVSSGSITATASVSLPDGSRTLGIPMTVESANDANTVVVLRGRLPRAESKGSYVVNVRLTDVEQGWEESLEPNIMAVAPESWLPVTPHIAMALGAVLCISLVFVYRDQLKDLSLTPKAPFDFAIHQAGITTFTKPGQRKAIRFIAGDKGLRVDIGRRGIRRQPTAVFVPTDRSSLSYRLRGSGQGWEYRMNQGDKSFEDYVPLGERGVELSFLDFVQRSTVDLKHGDHVVRISHSSYTAASEG